MINTMILRLAPLANRRMIANITTRKQSRPVCKPLSIFISYQLSCSLNHPHSAKNPRPFLPSSAPPQVEMLYIRAILAAVLAGAVVASPNTLMKRSQKLTMSFCNGCIPIGEGGVSCVNNFYIHWGDNKLGSWYLDSPLLYFQLLTILSSSLATILPSSTTAARAPLQGRPFRRRLVAALGRRPTAVRPLTRSWVPSAPVATATLATAPTTRTSKTTALVKPTLAQTMQAATARRHIGSCHNLFLGIS